MAILRLPILTDPTRHELHRARDQIGIALWIRQHDQPIVLSDEFQSPPPLNVFPADVSIPILQMDRRDCRPTIKTTQASVEFRQISQLGAH